MEEMLLFCVRLLKLLNYKAERSSSKQERASSLIEIPSKYISIKPTWIQQGENHVVTLYVKQTPASKKLR